MAEASEAPGTTTVGQALLDHLEAEGVERVFGIPGGGLGNLLVALKDRRDRLAYHVCRQETGAAYMADGYHRATGRLAVVMVTSGPGATNALTGTMNAHSSGTPMLTVTGEVAEQFFGRGYLQEGADAGLDVNAIFRAATGYSTVLGNPASCRTLIRQALRDALSLPNKAVHLSVPNNVAAEPIAGADPAATPSGYRAGPPGVSGDDVARAWALLRAARRPLLMLGSGCRVALRDAATLQALTDFVESTGIPLMTSADAKGIFPESHPLSLRVYGFAGCEWPRWWLAPEDPAAAPYDALLVLGSALRELSCNSWNPMLVPKGPLIQVDLDATVIGRAFDVSPGIVGEAGAFVRALAARARDEPADPAEVTARKALVADLKRRHAPFADAARRDDEGAPIEPAALVATLQRLLPRDALIFLDAGNSIGWAVHHLVVDPPMQVHSALSMGPMGFAVGAVIGAKIGQRGRTCVALAGDGAFMMQGAEISTARRYGVGAIWIVFCDDNLGMVSQGQAHFFPDRDDPGVWDDAYALGSPDLVRYAEGLGAQACVVRTPDDLERVMPGVLRGADVDGVPQVVVAHVRRDRMPPYYEAPYAPSPPPAPPAVGRNAS